jgi:probable rRNA maturation factor
VEFDAGDALRDLMVFAGEHELSIPRGDWMVVVRLTADEAIADLHARFFGDPEPTDVISFPAGDDLTAHAGTLGDIVISVETAREQAREAGHSAEREVAFLALHGLLHLCGHDDESPVDRKHMLTRQDQVLQGFEASIGRRW